MEKTVRTVWVLYSTEKRGFVVSMSPMVKADGEKRVPKMEPVVSASPKSDTVLAFPDLGTMMKVLGGYCLVTKTTGEEVFPASAFVPMQVEATETQLEGVACAFGTSGEEVA